MKIPSTRNHRQLAAWVNAQKLFDDQGRPVMARVDRVRTNTDRKIPGTRLRHPGKGRVGLALEIWPVGAPQFLPEKRLYRHESSETYRRHAEAREWVERNLRRSKSWQKK